MSDVRNAVADNVRKVLVFVGLALILLGGAIPAPAAPIAVPGIVCLFAAVLVAEPIEAVLRTDESGELPDDPLESLRERYARGEIDHDEFERRIERLVETENVDHPEAASESGIRDLDVELEDRRER